MTRRTSPHPDWIRQVLVSYYMVPGTSPTHADLAALHGVHVKAVAAVLRGQHAGGRPHQRALAAMAELGLEIRGGRVVPVAVGVPS